MIYNIDATNFTTNIETALSNAGILGTTYYKDTNWWIGTTTKTDKVLKLSATSNMYFGDAWTSGTTITNPKTLTSSTNPTTVATLITIPDGFVLCNSETSSRWLVFSTATKADNTTKKVVLSFRNASSSIGASYSTTDSTQIVVATNFTSPIMDAANYYYTSDIYLKTTDGKYFGKFSIPAILKARDNSVPYLLYGNDVVIPCGSTLIDSTNSVMYDYCLLLKNGAI